MLNVSRITLFNARKKFVMEIILNSILPDEETEAQGGFIIYPGAEGYRWTSLRDWLLASLPTKLLVFTWCLTRTTEEETLGGNH